MLFCSAVGIKKFLKRGREEEDESGTEGETQGRSKAKLETSKGAKKEGDTMPLGHKMEGNDQLQKMMEIMIDIQKEMKEIKEDNRKSQKEIREIREEWKAKEQEWKEDKKELYDRIEKIEKRTGVDGKETERLEELERREERRERKERQNNIIIKGWDVPASETLKGAVEELLRKELDATVKIKDAHWVGGGSKGKMVVAKMEAWEEKRRVMARKSKMKGTKLYIDNDMTPKEREIQRNIALIAEEERKNGHRTKIGYRKLTVNDVCFQWKEKEGLRPITQGKEGDTRGANFLKRCSSSLTNPMLKHRNRPVQRGGQPGQFAPGPREAGAPGGSIF